MAHLRYYVDGELLPRVDRLLRLRGSYLIGSAQEADIVVDAEGVPAQLARLEHGEGAWRVSAISAEVELQGQPLSGSAVLTSGDTLRLAEGQQLRFFDGAEWVRDVAPWAAAQTPQIDEAIGGDVVIVSAQEAERRGIGPVGFSFDLASTGLVAAWRRCHLAIVKKQPPGPERVVVEGLTAVELDGDQLTALVEERLGDAHEAALSKVDLSNWAHGDQFGWQPLAGAQCHAIRVAWERGLFTSVIWLPASDAGDHGLLVSVTSPEVDPFATQSLAQLMGTFALGTTPRTMFRAYLDIRSGDEASRKVALDEREQYVLGSAAGCDLVVSHEAVRKRHANLFLRGDRWMLVVELAALETTTVNGKPATESGHALNDRDEIRIGDPSVAQNLVIEFHNDVFTAVRPAKRAEPMDVEPPEVPRWPRLKRLWSRRAAPPKSEPKKAPDKASARAAPPVTAILRDDLKFDRIWLEECSLPAAPFSLVVNPAAVMPFEDRIVLQYDNVEATITGYRSFVHGPRQLNALIDERADCAPRSWAGRRLRVGRGRWSYFGEVCRLQIGSDYLTAVMPDADTCAALLPAPGGEPVGRIRRPRTFARQERMVGCCRRRS